MMSNNRTNVEMEMSEIGLNFSTSYSSYNNGNEFVKRGMCPTCGIQTHKVERTSSFLGKKSQKIPLTIEGQVRNGVCTKCIRDPIVPVMDQQQQSFHPTLPAYNNNNNNSNNNNINNNSNQGMMAQSPAPPPYVQPVPKRNSSQILVPTVLEVEDRFGDDCTVVSGITMDGYLLKEFGDDSSDSSESEYKIVPGQTRPKQSFGEVDDCPPPNAPRRTVVRTRGLSKKSLSKRRLNKTSTALEAEVYAIQEEASFSSNNRLTNEGLNDYSNHNSRNGNSNSSSHCRRRKKDEAFNIFGQHHNQDLAYSDQNNHENIDEELNFGNISSNNFQNEAFNLPGKNNGNAEQFISQDHKDNSLTEAYYFVEEEKATLSNQSQKSERKMPFSNNNDHGASTINNWASMILSQIPSLLDCLKLHTAETGVRENAFRSLAEIVWKVGPDAKAIVAQYNGIEFINSCMWAAMSDPCVQEAAVHLLFALSASEDANANCDVIVGNSAEEAVHALLFVMQSHINVESIQHAACGTLSCLAAASSNNEEINDGSLTGAVFSVMNAMDAHRSSRRVQEWGLRALYNQCVYSSNAESNMRILANGEGDPKFGPEVICRAVKNVAEDNIIIVEWACRLCWCLSSSEDVSILLCETRLVFEEIISVIQRYHVNPSAAGILEAAFGALGNFFNPKQNEDFLHDSVVVFHVIKSMSIHSTSEGLCTEGCALIAKFSTSQCTRELLAGVDVLDIVKAIFVVLQNFSDSLPLFEEAVGALICLSEELDNVKAYICSEESLTFLSLLTKRHSEHLPGQVMLCNLLGSILVDPRYLHEVVDNGGLELIFMIMKTHPMDKKIQEAVCLAVRNLSCHEKDETWHLLRGEPLNLLLGAMTAHPNSEAIQLHACCTMLNVSSQLRQEVDNISLPEETQIVDYFVRTIKNHLESGSILEMACAALWSVMEGSNERKERMMEIDGIDAVTCVIVMHPNEPKTLERAFGVLSCLSANPTFADAIANAQGVGNVVDAMRANTDNNGSSSSIALLEVGCLVLRNIVVACPEYVTEASNVTAIIINEMKKNPTSVDFSREACNLLWALAAMSKHCKEKILSLDGFSVLVNCLEHNNSYSDVQDAALGAFNQLAI